MFLNGGGQAAAKDVQQLVVAEESESRENGSFTVQVVCQRLLALVQCTDHRFELLSSTWITRFHRSEATFVKLSRVLSMVENFYFRLTDRFGLYRFFQHIVTAMRIFISDETIVNRHLLIIIFIIYLFDFIL